MSIALCLPVVLFNGVLMIQNLRAGLVFYFILAIVFPNARLAGLAISYEILAFPLLAFIWIYLHIRRPVEIPSAWMLIGVYFILLLFSSWFSLVRYSALPSLASLFYQVRFALLFLMGWKVLDRRTIEKIFAIVLMINLVGAVIQYLVPSSVNLFFQLYSKASQTSLATFQKQGFVSRALGTMTSPVYLGALALMGLAIFWGKILSGQRGKYRILPFAVAFIVGVLSLTKTFILGTAIILFFGLILKSISKVYTMTITGNVLRLRIRTITSTFVILAIMATITIWGIRFLDQSGYPVFWYFAHLVKPLEAFSPRASSEGAITSLVPVIIENPLLGVGLTQIHEEFIGDSAYFVVLHDSGFVGALILLLFFAMIMGQSIRRYDISGILAVGTVLIVGFAYPVFFRTYSLLIIMYACVPNVVAEKTFSTLHA